jgi:hypothetical protein
MDDGSRSPSPFEGREVVIHTRSIESKLVEVKSMDKTFRPRENIASILSMDEARAFLEITLGIRDHTGKPIFITKGDMTYFELGAANTRETTQAHEIFFYHRGNYRPLHLNNTTYLNKALKALRER